MRSQNPFTLTFGKKPDSFISRYENTSKVIDTFCNTSLSQTYLIEGVRGSGKTVLMTSIANELQSDREWIVIDLNPSLPLLDDMARRLNDSCRLIPNALKGINISFAGTGMGIDQNEALHDSISVIKSILDVMKKKKKKILITIDEVMHNDNMRIFASQFQIFIREDYPLYLIMTGLAENVHSIQNDPALTFLLRSPKLNLGPLSTLQINRKYREILGVDEERAKELSSITKGYAFAFQALGAVCWEHRGKMVTEKILENLDEMLDDYVYRKIWSTLTEKEKEILLSITHDDTKTSEICEKTGIRPNSYSKYRSNLIEKGLITSTGHGYNTLSLPRFYEVVKMY